MEHRERSHRLISKIVISEPQEKDGTENYRRTPETVTMEIHFEPVFSHKRHKTVDGGRWHRTDWNKPDSTACNFVWINKWVE